MTTPGPPEPLAADELRTRAVSGAAVMGARGVAVYTLGIAANLGLAAMLVPRDFGVIALGTVVLATGTYLSLGGFTAALISRPEEPTRRELEVVLGVQLAIGLLLAVGVAAVAAPAGQDGLVVATMAGALPILALRSPILVDLERRLQYRPIATAEVLEAAVYYAWAVGAVAAGLGVWGLATAVVVRAAVGTGWLLLGRERRRVRPRWSWSALRPVLRSSLQFQAAAVAGIAREQLVNVGVGIVGGLATLGVWNLAWRVIQVPMLLLSTVGRVAFPALARLLDAQEDPRPAIERTVAALAVLIGLVVVAMVAVAPAIPAVAGDEWDGVPAVLLWSGVALIVNAPVAAAAGGYLFARRDPNTVTAATAASAATWLAVALPLLKPLGPAAIGVGWLAAGLVASTLLWRPTAAATGASLAARRAAPTLLAVIATAGAWLVAHVPDAPFAGAALGIVAGELALTGGLFLFARDAVRDVAALLRRVLPLR